MWKQIKESVASFFTAERKDEEVEKKGRKSDRRRRARQALEKSGRWLFLLLLVGQNWLCVNAAAEGLQRRTGLMKRMQQQEVQVKESRLMEETPQRWKQPTGTDRTENEKKHGKFRPNESGH